LGTGQPQLLVLPHNPQMRYLYCALCCALVLLTVHGSPASGAVRAWEETITMPTWEIGPPQVHSVFSDAGGDIYPYTLNETLTDKRVDKQYTGVFLENEYIKVLILPEIGGRVHGALDKTNGYPWLYWQKTIKPGLISMTGAWISGGIEWNFPHGHRPSCFMPVDHRIVEHPDGSATVWIGETEPIYRMRWLVGVTAFPGRSYLSCDYIFVNPTDYRHPFMFWATSATHANKWSQAQYPGDVATGHGKQEFWNWPISEGVDLSWWENSPDASSYFAYNSRADWFGTYDHKAQAGMVHVADHHVMPGKKLWTWGSGSSGAIWEDILTESGGPYFEPQAGAWSDNQPDYHWISPHEMKTVHDYWYPVREIRGFHNATKDFAVNTSLEGAVAFGGVYATAVARDQRVVLRDTKHQKVLSEAVVTISPDKPYTIQKEVPGDTTVYDLHLAVYDTAGKLAIEVQQAPLKSVDLPSGQRGPGEGDPKQMNQDELYHAGEESARFANTDGAAYYYQEALRRDPKDSRVRTEMGFLALERTAWQEALDHFVIALERDGDNARIYYGRGLAYLGLGNYEEAYNQFYRATYSVDYMAPAYLNLARIDLRRGDFAAAIDKAVEAEAQNDRFADLPALKAAAYRHLGDHERALAEAERALALDPMHFMGGYERSLATADWKSTWSAIMRGNVQNYLELAAAYAQAGLYSDADAVLSQCAEDSPMVGYLRGYCKELDGDEAAAERFRARARNGTVRYINPHRLEEKAALEASLRISPRDAHAHLFLGNLLYARGQREDGLSHWREAVAIDPGLEPAWRNVGYGECYLKADLQASLKAYRNALELDPADARVLKELDEVSSSLGAAPADRLAVLEGHMKAVEARDDLVTTMVELRLNLGGEQNLRLAHEALSGRHFHSWEGRYFIHENWVEVNQKLGDLAMGRKQFETALKYYQQACEYPKNLEVAPHTPDRRAHLYWNVVKVYRALGKEDAAVDYAKKILAETYERPSIGWYFQALAHRALGDEAAYRAGLERLETAAREMASAPAAAQTEHWGARSRQAIGLYLLSLVLEEKGDATQAAAKRAEALKQDPNVERAALWQAQGGFHH